ncbi:MAG: hypothetical protein IT436_13775 [Phycisphaerales bacterium]|nr:hypothetical protein [Phycisphaerales bacterium]
MMSGLERVLGLKELRLGAADVALEWARPMPPWVWSLIVLAAVGMAGWSYWRLTGPRWARGVLGSLRALVLLLLAVVVAGPQLVKRPERVERDWVVVLLDRSASMNVADVKAGAGTGGGMISRDRQLREAVRAGWPAWEAAAGERNVLWMGFDAGAYELAGADDPSRAGPPALGPAEGRRTSLDRAIEQALRRVTARPVAGIVIASDGRSADEPGKGLLRRLQAEQIPVFSVPLGSAVPPTDVALRRVEAPRTAFADDLVPVGVEVERSGGPEGGTERALVQLLDDASGAVLDEKSVELTGDIPARVTLTTKPAAAGRSSWSVRVRPAGEDITPGNNEQKLALNIVDVPIRVLQIDGYPRWEFRYLKNLFLRESSIKSASLLLAADRRYIQEGSSPLQAIPTSPGEWSAFDVFVMGDVRPELFNPEQLEQIKEQVALRGAGLLWIGGPYAMPGAWAGTPLADLLPFSPSGGGAGGSAEGAERVTAWPGPVTMAPTVEAERLGVMRLGDEAGAAWPGALSDPMLGWTQLRWAQRIDQRALKPAAEVLARGVSASDEGVSAPLVVSMRYGAGRSIYVGTDEIWRWRYARGETLPERFWLPLVRLLARDSLARAGQAAVIEVSPARAGVGQPVRVTVKLLDQSLADSAVSGVTVRIARAGAEPGAGARGNEEQRLKLSAESAAGGAARAAGSNHTATWIADAPGTYRFEIVDPPVGVASGIEATAEVTLPDDEMREPAADHIALGLLSAQTSGRVVPAESMGEIPAMLPSRQIRIVGAAQIETLWDRPVVLGVIVLLLGLEWVGRKVLRLS